MHIPENLIPFLPEETRTETWSESQATYPNAPPFLTPDAVSENANWANCSPKATSFLQETAARISADPDLSRLTWHFHHLLFLTKTHKANPSTWPLLTPLLDKHGGAFYLLIALSGIPIIRAFHTTRHIPESTTRDTCSDIAIWAEHYRTNGIERNSAFVHPAGQGFWGLDTRIFSWLNNHFTGDLFRLGRLQFIQRPYRCDFLAFRNRTSRRVALLAKENIAFRADGEIDGNGGIYDPEHAWNSHLTSEPNRVTGTPIHPSGKALDQEITLDLNTWEPILSPGDPILEIHIPEDGPMSFDACGDSFHKALNFFPRYFSDRPFRAFCCTSWLLDPTYQNLLSPESNIVRLQKECYLFPLFCPGGRNGLTRIFGPHAANLATAPRDTTMRRAVLDHLDSGGYLKSGGALLFPENLDWGTQTYLKQPT